MLQESFPTGQTAPAQLRDTLTGTLSRAAFQTQFQLEIDRARRYKTPFALLILDLDHFKSINDAFGHSRGDQVLVEFARRVERVVRNSDALYRFGGDEFTMLVPGTNLTQGAVLAQRLLDVIQEKLLPGDPPIALSLSIGVAAFPEDGTDQQTLFEIADQRHYQAKRGGRGRVVAANQPDNEEALPPYRLSPDRLIERDSLLETARHFLNKLAEQSPGILVVQGEAGAGHSRFVNSIQTQAELQNFTTFEIKASVALRGRYLGAINETLQNWPQVTMPGQDIQLSLASLDKYLAQANKYRLLVTVEDASFLDNESLNFISQLSRFAFSQVQEATGHNLEMGLVWSTVTSNQSPAEQYSRWWQNISHHEVIHLAPLTPAGVWVWLRQAFNWEPSERLVDWFFGQTRGLPALVKRGIIEMVEQGLVYPGPTGWETSVGFENYPLAERLRQFNHDLPPGLADFNTLPALVGREPELKRLKELITNPVSSLLTVVAAGGMGKTRLAWQVAAENYGLFQDGVFVVPMTGVSPETPLSTVIGQVLGLKAPVKDPDKTLFNHLRQKNLLLVLDNFEHFLEQTALLGTILQQASGVRLLVTSREQLKLPGEITVALEGLVYPIESQSSARLTPAVQLFIQTSRNLSPNFELTEVNRAAVNQICRLLRGLPLAINLAAGWIDAFSPAEILGELERKGLELLSTREKEDTRPDLRNVLDTFWGLLNHYEGEVLYKLAVFAGGFDRTAGSRVADASVFFLEGLVLRGLLYRQGNRYTMHEMVRQYLSDKLTAQPAINEATLEKFALYYLEFFQQISTDFKQDDIATLKQAQLEIENGLAAWKWLVKHERMDLWLKLAEPLFYVYRNYSSQSTKADILDEAITKLRVKIAANDIPVGLSPDGLKEILGRLLLRRIKISYRTAKFETVVKDLDEIIENAATLNHPGLVLTAWNQKGTVLKDFGKHQEAIQALETALSFIPPGQENTDEVDILMNLADLSLMTGKSKRAREIYRRVEEELSDQLTPSQKRVLPGKVGFMEAFAENYEQAIRYYTEFLTLHQELNNTNYVYTALSTLGSLYYALGKFDQAFKYYEDGLRLARQYGDSMVTATVYSNLGQLYYDLGDNAKGRDYNRQSYEVARAVNQEILMSNALLYLGYAELASGDAPAAEGHYREALALRQKLGQQDGVIEAKSALLDLALKEDRLDEIETLVNEIRDYISTNELPFYTRPAGIWLNFYYGLKRLGLDEEAATALSTGHEKLLATADGIEDPDLRESFLGNVGVHRQLLEVYASASGKQT